MVGEYGAEWGNNERVEGEGDNWARRGGRHRVDAASALAPTVDNFSLTIRIRRRRRRKGAITAAARRTAGAAERRGGRKRGEVSTGPF